METAMKRLIVAMLVLAAFAAGTAGAATRDRTPPALRFVTQEDDIVVGGPLDHDAAGIAGRAYDRSGVRAVTVSTCRGQHLENGGWVCEGLVDTARAALACTGTTCDWRAAAPLEPGSYLVFARANDRRSNVRSTGPISIYVV